MRSALLVMLAVPLAAWFLVKPVRLLAPGWADIHCPTASVCVDDVVRFAAAAALHAEAMAFTATAATPLTATPRLIFFSTESCAQWFGPGARSAVTLGTFGTVIGPRAWQPHYVRHEMIHTLQAENTGVLRLLFKPKWFVEGMAYALSGDPRAPLAEPWESHRASFAAWYKTVGRQFLWVEAGKL